MGTEKKAEKEAKNHEGVEREKKEQMSHIHWFFYAVFRNALQGKFHFPKLTSSWCVGSGSFMSYHAIWNGNLSTGTQKPDLRKRGNT